MLTFHAWLDRIFKKRVSFSIFFRIWLTFALLIITTCGLVLYYTQQTVRPSAKRVVEDSLVDASRLLAVMVADDVANAKNTTALNRQLNRKLSHAFNTGKQPLVWYDQKTKSQFHLYITDHKGKLIYDSHQGKLGADFSRWNDVYLTLQGKYGARSTDINGHSVMYVASPIIKNGKVIGVLSVGKPTNTLAPYISKSTEEIIKIIVAVMVLILLASMLMAWWLRRSIQMVNRYTQGLASHSPPHFYLGKELNELIGSIHDMKDAIENKAYVTEYVHTLTHELKSPLTAITACGELLAEDLTSDERLQFSSLIKEQTGKLTHLVDSLLTLAKIEQPNFRLEPTICTLDALISTCLHYQSANIGKLGKVVHFEPKQHTVWADEFWLAQAIQNVIDNAIHYGNTQLVISIHQDADAVIIDIINDSPALPAYVSQKAFDRYFSLNNPKSTKKGTGLGLTLVKQIIGLHGGSVSFTVMNHDEFAQSHSQHAKTDTHWVVVQIRLPIYPKHPPH